MWHEYGEIFLVAIVGLNLIASTVFSLTYEKWKRKYQTQVEFNARMSEHTLKLIREVSNNRTKDLETIHNLRLENESLRSKLVQ